MQIDGLVPEELAVFPGFLLARLGHTASRRFHALMEPLGLHPRHFGVMNIVAAQAGISQQRLHDQTGIDPSSMVAVIDELERMGLAERRPFPDDRRARAIYLTEAGEETLERAREAAGNFQREFFKALTASERRTLHELLRKLAASDL